MQNTFAFWQETSNTALTQPGQQSQSRTSQREPTRGRQPLARWRHRRGGECGSDESTFRDILSTIEDEWGDFRRVLRRHQPLFDRLFTYAREHADAASNLNHSDRLAPLLVSIDPEYFDLRIYF